MLIKVVPICGNLKFRNENGYYSHIERLEGCQVDLYKMVERYLGRDREEDIGPDQELKIGRGVR